LFRGILVPLHLGSADLFQTVPPDPGMRDMAIPFHADHHLHGRLPAHRFLHNPRARGLVLTIPDHLPALLPL
jgi:hypothetical protein